jgi:hypothetical protein
VVAPCQRAAGSISGCRVDVNLRNLHDQPGAELGLPDDIDIERGEASPGAATHGGACVDVHKRRKESSIETDPHVPGGQQLDAASAAGHEAPLVICRNTKASQSNESGQKRPDAACTQLLDRTAQPMINDDVPLQSLSDQIDGVDVSDLMGEEPFDVQSVRQWHIDRQADGRSAVRIHRSTGYQFEEVATEAIAGKWRNLDALRMGRYHRQRSENEAG